MVIERQVRAFSQNTLLATRYTTVHATAYADKCPVYKLLVEDVGGIAQTLGMEDWIDAGESGVCTSCATLAYKDNAHAEPEPDALGSFLDTDAVSTQ